MTTQPWTPRTRRCDWRGRLPIRDEQRADMIFTPYGSLTHRQGRCDQQGTEYAEAVDSWYCARHIRSTQARG